jgi:hypothetical protein
MTLSIMALSIKTLSITAFTIIALSITAFTIIALSIMALSIIALSIMVFSITGLLAILSTRDTQFNDKKCRKKDIKIERQNHLTLDRKNT